MARLVVDGYNLLLTSGLGSDEDARERLVREAALYRGERGVDVTIVFDSRRGAGSASATRYPGVRVLFARGDADTAIVEMVRRSRSPRDLLVVTSDRRLADQVRDLGARCEDVARFRARAGRRRAAAPKSEKPAGVSSAEVDEWLRIFAQRRDEE